MSHGKPLNEQRAQIKNAKILVIDDEQGIRDLLSNELSMLGYHVRTATNGLEGLEMLKKESCQLVISDMKMPKMDGLQVLQGVKKLDPDIEVILITGYGTVENAVMAMKRGAYDFVQKPFNLDEVLSLVEKALEKADLKAMVALYETSKAVFSAVKLEDLLPILTELSLKLLKADDVSIMLMGPDRKLKIAASHGLSTEIKQTVHLALGEGVAGKVAEGKTAMIIVGPAEQDPRFKGVHGNSQIKSSILCPLLSKTDILGVLCAARTSTEAPFSQMDLRYANIFTSQIAQAVENARLYRELETKIESLNHAYSRLAEMQTELIQSEKLAAIGELASGVAHELNNPLTTVIGLVDLLMESVNLTQENRDDLKTIKEQADRCSKIILNLLQFSRRHESEKKVVHVHDVLDKTLQLIQYDFKSSGVELRKEYKADSVMIKVDPYQLQQVFLNIMNNARYAMKDSAQPQLTIRTTKAEGQRVQIFFTDNGCGIPEDIVHKIFEPFFTTKEVGKGTGLGLSISYGIVREHGGEIHVQSHEGQGTTFRIELPISVG